MAFIRAFVFFIIGVAAVALVLTYVYKPDKTVQSGAGHARRDKERIKRAQVTNLNPHAEQVR